MDREHLHAYLLHRLSDADRLALSERCITDPDVHEALRAAEAELLDDYVRGALNEEDRRDVQTHLLTSAVQRRKLAFAESLRVGLVPQPAVRTQRASWTLPAAAVLLLAAIGLSGWLIRENRALRNQLATSAEPVATVATGRLATAFVPAGTVRSEASVPTVRTSPDLEVLRLDLEIEPGDEASSFDAVIARGSGVVWRGGPVRAVARDGMFVAQLWIPAQSLAAGAYEIRLVGASGVTLYYNLRITQ